MYIVLTPCLYISGKVPMACNFSCFIASEEHLTVTDSHKLSGNISDMVLYGRRLCRWPWV